jgi:hypothetical protein
MVSPRSTTVRHAAFAATVLYLPLGMNFLSRLIPIDVVLVNAVPVLAMLLVALSRSHRLEDRSMLYLVRFCLLFLLIGLLNFFREGRGFFAFIAKQSGVFLALALAMYFATFDPVERQAVLRKLVPVMVIGFAIQLALSVYESIVLGDFLVQSYDWNTSGAEFGSEMPNIEDRLQTGLIFSGLQLPFNTPFSGMLGQHNHWGTQLPFYNLVFVYAFLDRLVSRWWTAPAVILAPIAAIFNTSRFGVMSILIVDVAFFALAAKVPRWVKGTILAIPVLLLLVNIEAIIDLGTTYVNMTDTFGGRVETWSTAWPQVITRGVFDFVFGSTNSIIADIQRQLDWADFENLALSLMMEKGVLVMGAFLAMLVVLWNSAHASTAAERVALRLLVVCMIVVSLWSNVLFRATSFGIVAVLMCGLSKQNGNGHEADG